MGTTALSYQKQRLYLPSGSLYNLKKRTALKAELVHGYCAAVRSALTDDARAPLDAAGLRLKGRLEAVCESLQRVGKKGGALRH